MRIRNLRVTPVRANRRFSGLGQSSECASLGQQVSLKQAELATKMSNPAYAGIVPQLQAELNSLVSKMNAECSGTSTKEDSGSVFKNLTQGLTSLLTAAAPAAAQIYSADQAAKAQKAAAKAAAQPSMFPQAPIYMSAPAQSNTGLILAAGAVGVAALAALGLIMSRKKSAPAARRRKVRRRKH